VLYRKLLGGRGLILFLAFFQIGGCGENSSKPGEVGAPLIVPLLTQGNLPFLVNSFPR